MAQELALRGKRHRRQHWVQDRQAVVADDGRLWFVEAKLNRGVSSSGSSQPSASNRFTVGDGVSVYQLGPASPAGALTVAGVAHSAIGAVVLVAVEGEAEGGGSQAEAKQREAEGAKG
jgi:hypothetical protein